MCVIAVYPKVLALNQVELHNCFQFNPDGAGVMWQAKDGVHIKKGFMKEDDFMNFIKELPTDVDRVLHFRIATSGKISAGCCHPFPVCDDFKQMMKSEQVVSLAYAHNGILPDYTPSKGIKSSFSDTMVFGKDVLSHLVKMGVDLFDPVIGTLIENTIDTDKMVIMSKSEMVTLGKFLTAPSGAKYSNCSYERDRFAKKSSYLPFYSGYGYDCYSRYCKEAKSVTFDATITFDTSHEAFTGWTKDDFFDFISENLVANGITVYGEEFIVNKSFLTITVGCWSEDNALKGKYRNVLNHSKMIKDSWNEPCYDVDIEVKVKITNLLVEDYSY